VNAFLNQVSDMNLKLFAAVISFALSLSLLAARLPSLAAEMTTQSFQVHYDTAYQAIFPSRSGVPLMLNAFSGSKPLPNGLQVKSGNAILQVVALHDDVIRVRVGPQGKLFEDASWAVPAGVRQSSVAVTAEENADAVGFRTRALSVKIGRSDLRLSVSDVEGNILQEDAEGWPLTVRGQGFRVYKKMPEDEHYFGLGDKVGPLDRRGQSFVLWNTDTFEFQESTDPIYKSIPFFMALRKGRAMGVLLDNTWRSNFDFGKASADIYSFAADGGPIDYYIIYGPDPKRVINTYAWLTGTSPLPPVWSLGYQQSRYSYETESRVREIALKLRADKIPSDVLYLDIDYQEQNRPFTVDSQRFPHFSDMIRDLRQQHFRVVTITDLHIGHLPNGNYAPYNTGLAGDHFLKNPDGSLYVGPVWPGPSVFPDFTRQSTREWWGQLYSRFVSDGVAGFWNDMNEPSIFLTPTKTMPPQTQHRIDEPGFVKRSANHLEIHNVYGMENSRATYEGLLKLTPNLRPFVLTRATYAGGQRYAATWTGDNSSTWNHLRLTTPMLLNLGLSGFGMSGADVGGFAGTPQPELLTKWIELSTFQPIDRNHTGKGTGDQEPWVHGSEHEAIRRRYIEERYRLLPYLYTTAEEMSRNGLPIVRPLFLEFASTAEDGHPLDLDAPDQFLFGPSLLVAPFRFPDELDSYDVVLPPGDWFDYWTGERVSGASKPQAVTRIKVRPRLDVLPVYARAGSIIPMQPLTQSTDQLPQGPLTLRVYPGPNCAGSLYQDDGTTLDYQRGSYLRMKFSCEAASDSLRIHIGAPEGSYQPWWKRYDVQVFGWNSSTARVLLNGNANLAKVSVEAQRHVLTLDLPVSGEAELQISAVP
jgi:alpha-glucosidase